jgi:Gram-negative bacterial TonB protein C-terminal
MTPADPEADFLSRIPGGGLLSGLLHLLLSAERREEFLGDLVEEGALRLRLHTPVEVALWMWGQTLRSAPSLVGWRLRRLATRHALPPGGGLLVASRGGHRGWPLSLALSVSAHAIVILGVASWVFSRVEEIDPGHFEVMLPPEMLADPPPPLDPAAVASSGFDGMAPVQARVRRWKASRRPIPAPSASESAASDPTAPTEVAAALPPGGDLPPPAARDRGAMLTSGLPALPSSLLRSAPRAPSSPAPSSGDSTRARQSPLQLGPQVVEKRCLSCPTPQLPYPYGRLGIGQEVQIRSCVNVRGQVSAVTVIRGIDPVVDAKVIETVRGWRLTPYSLNGHPVPFCYTTRFLFTTH